MAATRSTPAGNLPNLLVIGAMKAGTTALHYYLGLHPEIFMSDPKELDYFVTERNWSQDVDWYRSHFHTDAAVRGDTSPSYSNFPLFTDVPSRAHELIPDAKLIYLVRDPIERFISHYVHLFTVGRELRSLHEVIADPRPYGYMDSGRYYMQIEQYLPYYDRSNILVITQEDLLSHRQETLRRIFRFLEVDEGFDSRGFSGRRHRSSDKRIKGRTAARISKTIDSLRIDRVSRDLAWHIKRVMCLPFSRTFERPIVEAADRRRLVECFGDDVNKLRRFTDQQFKAWRID